MYAYVAAAGRLRREPKSFALLLLLLPPPPPPPPSSPSSSPQFSLPTVNAVWFPYSTYAYKQHPDHLPADK